MAPLKPTYDQATDELKKYSIALLARHDELVERLTLAEAKIADQHQRLVAEQDYNQKLAKQKEQAHADGYKEGWDACARRDVVSHFAAVVLERDSAQAELARVNDLLTNAMADVESLSEVLAAAKLEQEKWVHRIVRQCAYCGELSLDAQSPIIHRRDCLTAAMQRRAVRLAAMINSN